MSDKNKCIFFSRLYSFSFQARYSGIMALIEADNPASTGATRDYWQDQLRNTRVLIFELDKAILKLERQEIESYTVDTGQTTFTARRVNLPELLRQRAALLKQAQEIEALLENADNSGSCFIQVVPF
jgi:hypothetical protein